MATLSKNKSQYQYSICERAPLLNDMTQCEMRLLSFPVKVDSLKEYEFPVAKVYYKGPQVFAKP